MKCISLTLIATLSLLIGALAGSSETQSIMLSGNGPSDAVEWDFQITAGRRAGEKAKIPVPSQWEQHGFGDYDYGQVPDEEKHKEDGVYQRVFTVPESWRGQRVRIVFDGSMTDTTVTVNGQSAGPMHQGAFYRFHYDITDKFQFGKENRLEVLVSKDSANPSIEGAERGADYWVFGGIFRPVWLEARPPQCIEWTAIDAKADGAFHATVHLEGAGSADKLIARVMTRDGKNVGKPIESAITAGNVAELHGMVPAISPWSAEAPNLYQVEFTLMQGKKILHRATERFGFRTLEVRPGQGVFVNGTRITVKGVNRHCFRPKSGRALDPKDSVDDVRLIKSMNMNAVRCSHYSPDKAFLEACDELGLYVEDELCTWQQPILDTPSARRLVGELIRRDVNHPSILWWANGNEGGWNKEVDGDFAQWDLQQRPVLHPWANFSGFQTLHYPGWKDLQKILGGQSLVMPTEYLHGLYDGGHGAGLEDYWNAITASPIGVGGFLWVLADEGIERTDRGGAIDNWGTNAPDGIVGPRHEKEASYLTIKDLFSPVQISMKRLPAGFDGKIELRNGYDLRNLSGVRFTWKLSGGKKSAASGKLPGPDVKPKSQGVIAIPLPEDWREYGVLELRADDAEDNELWTWSWQISEKAASTASKAKPDSGKPVDIAEHDGALMVSTDKGVNFTFDARSGLLRSVTKGDVKLSLGNGPRLVGSLANNIQPAGSTAQHHLLESGALRIDGQPDGAFKSFAWTIHPDGRLDLEYSYQIDQPAVFHGITFDLPESELTGFAWTGQGPERVWANRMRGTRFGSFENAFNKLKPGIDYGYPVCPGFYAGIQQSDIRTKQGNIHVTCHQDDTFLRIGTNDEGERIAISWPEGNFSVLHAVSAIGNKFQTPDTTGPQGIPHQPPGPTSGKVTFQFN